MLENRLFVTYTDDYKIWPWIESQFRSYLPLSQLQWLNPLGNSHCSKTVDILDIDILPWTATRQRFVVSATAEKKWRPEALTHIYLMYGEDIPSYKEKGRKKLKEWIEKIEATSMGEWIIIHVTAEVPLALIMEDSTVPMTNPRFHLRGTVYDRIRTEFASATKREKIFQIKAFSVEASSKRMTFAEEAWNGFFQILKESVVLGFNAQLLQIYDIVRKMDVQRHVPGWNYCQFFLVKEKLAALYESMYLYQEALLQYDELEACFFDIYPLDAKINPNFSQELPPWMDSFGGETGIDDSRDIFVELSRNKAKEHICENKISVFEFHCFLFLRQSELLIALRQPLEFMRRSNAFISSFSQCLRQRKQTLGQFFAESWIFTMALAVIRESESMLIFEEIWDQRHYAAKGDLVNLALRQLLRIGIDMGFIPRHFGLISSNSLAVQKINSYLRTSENDLSNTSHEFSFMGISNHKLLLASSSVDGFNDLFNELIEQSVELYDKAGYFRHTLYLRFLWAQTLASHDEYARACELLKSVVSCMKKVDGTYWDILLFESLSRLAHYSKKANEHEPYSSMPFSESTQHFSHIGLDFFYTYLECCLDIIALFIYSSSHLIEKDKVVSYLDVLKNNKDALKEDINRPLAPWFSCENVTISNKLSDSVVSIEVLIDSFMPDELVIDTLNVHTIDETGHKSIFAANKLVLQQRSNKISAICASEELNEKMKELFAIRIDLRCGHLLFAKIWADPIAIMMTEQGKLAPDEELAKLELDIKLEVEDILLHFDGYYWIKMRLDESCNIVLSKESLLCINLRSDSEKISIPSLYGIKDSMIHLLADSKEILEFLVPFSIDTTQKILFPLKIHADVVCISHPGQSQGKSIFNGILDFRACLYCVLELRHLRNRDIIISKFNLDKPILNILCLQDIHLMAMKNEENYELNEFLPSLVNKSIILQANTESFIVFEDLKDREALFALEFTTVQEGRLINWQLHPISLTFQEFNRCYVICKELGPLVIGHSYHFELWLKIKETLNITQDCFYLIDDKQLYWTISNRSRQPISREPGLYVYNIELTPQMEGLIPLPNVYLIYADNVIVPHTLCMTSRQTLKVQAADHQSLDRLNLPNSEFLPLPT